MKRLKIMVVLLAVLVVGANVMVIANTGGLDHTPPELTVPEQVLEISVTDPQEAYLAGVTAWDDRDGDLSEKVLVEHISQLTGKDTAKVTYGVFDQAGNGSTATRTIRFTDYTGPKFQLSQPLNFSLGRTVTLMDRLTAWDDLDGDITNKIRVSSANLSNDLEGIYRITAQVTNSLGDTHILELPVVLTEQTGAAPQILLTDYIVYMKKGDAFDPENYLDSVTDPNSKKTVPLSQVEIQSQVDTAQAGTYDVVYSYEGEKENAQVILTVVVME